VTSNVPVLAVKNLNRQLNLAFYINKRLIFPASLAGSMGLLNQTSSTYGAKVSLKKGRRCPNKTQQLYRGKGTKCLFIWVFIWFFRTKSIPDE
jgi:hypothetical protein